MVHSAKLLRDNFQIWSSHLQAVLTKHEVDRTKITEIVNEPRNNCGVNDMLKCLTTKH